MRTVSILLLALTLLTCACAPRTNDSSATTPTLIDSASQNDSMPHPDYTQNVESASASDPETDSASQTLVPAERPGTYWVTNPASGSRLHGKATYPPAMLSDALDKQIEKTIVAYAWHIIENVL